MILLVSRPDDRPVTDETGAAIGHSLKWERAAPALLPAPHSRVVVLRGARFGAACYLGCCSVPAALTSSLLQELQDALRHLVGLGQHGGASLVHDLVPGDVHHLDA